MVLFPVVNGVEVLMAPPPGWLVNFTNPTRDYMTVRELKWAFGIEYPIATLFVLQGLYTSIFLVRRLSIDDCALHPQPHLENALATGTNSVSRRIDLIVLAWVCAGSIHRQEFFLILEDRRHLSRLVAL